jgi:hypothetical protein
MTREMSTANPSRHSGARVSANSDVQLHIGESRDSGSTLRSVSRNDVGCASAFSRRNAPESYETSAQENEGAARPLSEGAGNAGCPLHPRPVCKGRKHTVVTTVAPEHPAFPHAMVLTAYAVLSPATNSSCHRHRRISGVARPGWARITSADLAPATGARTTRFCRPHQRRSSTRVDRSRIKDPPCNSLARRRCRGHRIPSQRS